ncbi:MAG: RnfABCDGE type electron transport complex subunit B [Lentisphaeria bacterium]
MTAVILLVILGLVLGFIIGLAARFMAVKHDPRIEQTADLLPGVNCGACGYAGCSDFARALVEGEASPIQCPVSSEEGISKIADFLDLSIESQSRKVAVVHCGGDNRLARWNGAYNGILDCASAHLIGGTKACEYGCLGFGTCARTCPFGAIEITKHGLAVVHPELCTGCGKCISVCPRQIIELVPADAPLHNLCNNPQKGAITKKVCDVSCIGCRKCVKEAEEGQMYMEESLARVNYDNPPSAELAQVCPTASLQPALSVKNTMPALQDDLA